MSLPTQITIRPERDALFPSSATRLAGERHRFGTANTTADARFFGEDGPGLSDLVDAVNPLQHIPFISTLYEEATGQVASPVSKLIGGALIGGPIGFLASLADVIFTQETGHSMGGAVVAALVGEEAPAATQIAAAKTPSEPTVETPVAEILPPLGAPADTYAALQNTQSQMTAAARAIGKPYTAGSSEADRAMLDLFGAQAKSAHDSYRKAQFAPYLKDVTISQVM